MAAGVLLALKKADTIEEAEAVIQAIRPGVNISPEFKRDLKTLFPSA